MNKVRWGIIGSGGIARMRTLPGMLLAKNAECLAVMDLKEDYEETIEKCSRVRLENLKSGMISSVFTSILRVLSPLF